MSKSIDTSDAREAVQAAEWILAAAALVALDGLRTHTDEPAIAVLVDKVEALKAARDTLNTILDARDAA